MDKKVHRVYNLSLMERRLGYETGVKDEIFGNCLSMISKII